MPDDDGRPKDYDVGYGKPPVATRFKPGQSGNPKGRSSGSKNLKSMFKEALDATVQVTERGQAKKVPIRKVIASQVAAKAARGDLKSAQMLVAIEDEVLGRVGSPTIGGATPPLTQADRPVLADIVRRIRASQPVAAPAPAEPVAAADALEKSAPSQADGPNPLASPPDRPEPPSLIEPGPPAARPGEPNASQAGEPQ